MIASERVLTDALGSTARQLGWTLIRVATPPGKDGEQLGFLFSLNQSPYGLTSSREKAKARVAVLSRIMANEITRDDDDESAP